MTEEEVRAEARDILEAADAENRDLTQAESARFDQLSEARADFELERRSHRSRGTVAGGREGTEHQIQAAAESVRRSRETRAETWVDQAGREVRMLKAGDKLSESRSWPSEIRGVKVRDLDAGRALAGIVTGDWRNRVAERRAIDPSPTGGGVLIPDVLAAQFLDLARAKVVTQLAGARQFEMTGAEVTIARLAGDFTPQWRGPSVPIAESTPNFGAITLKARTLGCWFRAPRELIADAPNAPEVLVNSLATAMAVEIDRAALVGQAAKEEPMGLLNAGIGTTTGGGSLLNYSKFVVAAGAILTANGPAPSEMSYILPPRTWIVLSNLVDTLGQPMRMPDAISGMRGFVTTGAPITLGAGTEAFVVVGDFSQMLQGVRAPLAIEPTIIGGGDTSTNVFTSHQMAIKVTWRGDNAIMRPSWFNYLTGVTS